MRAAPVVLLVSGVAHAAPGLTLPDGGVQATLTGEITLSADNVGKPTSIAPDVAYGITDDVTLGLVTSTFGTTGFRGGAGDGLCVTGASNGCAHAFDNGGVEALVSLVRGAAAVAFVGGVYSFALDQHWVDGKLGAKMRATFGAASLVF